MKKKYVTPEIEIIDFENKDIITASRMTWDGNNDEDTGDYGELH